MNPLAGIHAKHTHKQCYPKQFFWVAASVLAFFIKSLIIDERKSKKHLKNKSISKILWQKIT